MRADDETMTPASSALIRVSGTPCWAVAIVTVSEQVIGASVGGFEPADYARLDLSSSQTRRCIQMHKFCALVSQAGQRLAGFRFPGVPGGS